MPGNTHSKRHLICGLMLSVALSVWSVPATAASSYGGSDSVVVNLDVLDQGDSVTTPQQNTPYFGHIGDETGGHIVAPSTPLPTSAPISLTAPVPLATPTPLTVSPLTPAGTNTSYRDSIESSPLLAPTGLENKNASLAPIFTPTPPIRLKAPLQFTAPLPQETIVIDSSTVPQNNTATIPAPTQNIISSATTDNLPPIKLRPPVAKPSITATPARDVAPIVDPIALRAPQQVQKSIPAPLSIKETPFTTPDIPAPIRIETTPVPVPPPVALIADKTSNNTKPSQTLIRKSFLDVIEDSVEDLVGKSTRNAVAPLPQAPIAPARSIVEPTVAAPITAFSENNITAQPDDLKILRPTAAPGIPTIQNRAAPKPVTASQNVTTFDGLAINNQDSLPVRDLEPNLVIAQPEIETIDFAPIVTPLTPVSPQAVAAQDHIVEDTTSPIDLKSLVSVTPVPKKKEEDLAIQVHVTPPTSATPLTVAEFVPETDETIENIETIDLSKAVSVTPAHAPEPVPVNVVTSPQALQPLNTSQASNPIGREETAVNLKKQPDFSQLEIIKNQKSAPITSPVSLPNRAPEQPQEEPLAILPSSITSIAIAPVAPASTFSGSRISAPEPLNIPATPAIEIETIEAIPPQQQPPAQSTQNSLAPSNVQNLIFEPLKTTDVNVFDREIAQSVSIQDTKREERFASQKIPAGFSSVNEEISIVSAMQNPNKPLEPLKAPSNESISARLAALSKATKAPAQQPNPNVQSISFNSPRLDLSNSAKINLDQMSERLKNTPNARLELRSYATGLDGTAGSARKASMSRAVETRNYLLSKGVSEDKIDVRALGNATSIRPINRVDLIIVQ